MEMTKTPLFLLKIILFSFFLQLTAVQNSVSPPSLNSDDEEILMSINNQWSDQLFYIDSAVSPCSWFGVECTKGNIVTRIFLKYQNINGEIPASICNLKNLTHLDLSYNHITGHFPTFLYNCTNLQTLNLCGNSLDGKLPNDINNLSPKLQHLDLSRNYFSAGDIPRSVGMLKGLISLSLGYNLLNGTIPSELGNLENLEELDMRYNYLVGEVPSGLLLLKNLSLLNLNQNQLSGGLPGSIKAMNLRKIDLSFNNLNGKIPPEIRNLASLDTLKLSSNYFSGSLHAAFGYLPNLKFLDLSSNNLSGEIPPELGRVGFTMLNLTDNNLSGKIPSAFDNSKYENSFSGNANLCSNSRALIIHRCSLDLFTIFMIIIIVIIIIILLQATIILALVLRRVNKKPESQQQADWIMIPFHNINFTKANIIKGLTEDNVIGSGGCGKIYHFDVNDSGSRKVAVKKMWDNRKLSHALEKQIIAEAEILGKIRHINIVKLLCYISKQGSKLLVYEYMENQSLDMWLHRKHNSLESSRIRYILDWPTRLKIAIGAAKGLCYMHHDCSPPVIHRDVKSSNILLDSEFNAKIADFGLAKMSPEYMIGEPHTASAVAGSFGYIAPEYWRTRRVSEKIDMYSFGVVLLELATGKEAREGNDHLNLAEWSWKHYIEGRPMEDILDGDIKGVSNVQEMMNVLKAGLMCISIAPSSRPSMRQVVRMLTEYTCNDISERTTQIDIEEEPIN